MMNLLSLRADIPTQFIVDGPPGPRLILISGKSIGMYCVFGVLSVTWVQVLEDFFKDKARGDPK